MNIAKKFMEEKGIEWPEPPKTFDDLKDGCPWRHKALADSWGDVYSRSWCKAISKKPIYDGYGSDCKEDNCAVLYWLRKMGEMK